MRVKYSHLLIDQLDTGVVNSTAGSAHLNSEGGSISTVDLLVLTG